MRFLVLLSVLLGWMVGVQAQLRYKIWEGTALTGAGVMAPELIAYPAHQNLNSRVAVIICPGGSYHHLGMTHEGYEVAEWFQNNGVNAFVLRYRVGFWGYHHPAMIEDLQRSIELLREQAAQWNIDTARIGLIGFSAGGHLVASGGTLFKEDFLIPLGIQPKVSLRPNFVVSVYPVISMEDSLAHKRSRKNLLGSNYTDAQRDRMSLEKQVKHDDPPMMIVVAKDDPVVDWRNGYYFYQNLQNAGVDSKLLLNEKGGHGFGIDPKKGGAAALWNIECINWLRQIGMLPDYITVVK